VIKSFKDVRTQAVFNGESRKGLQSDILAAARRKLRYLHAAVDLNDLRSPPGNRLEALRGDRRGNIRSGSTISFGFALFGPRTAQLTLR
jgi:proteic killer suppression protein